MVSERTSVADAAPLRRRPLRRFQLSAMVCVALAAILMLAVPVAAGSARFVWNVTASAPAGLYRITHEPWFRGDRVAVLPREALGADLERRGVLSKGKLLIKRVAAVTGDRVCRQEAIVSINGEIAAKVRVVDSHGMPLPSWQGCVTLDDGQVFLLGDTPGSYDGRYFGVTPKAEIVGRAEMLLEFSTRGCTAPSEVLSRTATCLIGPLRYNRRAPAAQGGSRSKYIDSRAEPWPIALGDPRRRCRS